MEYLEDKKMMIWRKANRTSVLLQKPPDLNENQRFFSFEIAKKLLQFHAVPLILKTKWSKVE